MNLHVLMVEIEQQFVGFLVIGLDGGILEIAARGHEAVDLVGPPLHDVLDFDRLLPLLHVLLGLVLAGQHGVRDGYAGCVGFVDHGRVAGGGGFELRPGLGQQVHDLAAPAVTEDAPFFDRGSVRFGFFENLGHAFESLGGCGFGLGIFVSLLQLVAVNVIW